MSEYEYLSATIYYARKNGHEIREPSISELDELYKEIENKNDGEKKEAIEEFVYVTLGGGETDNAI